MPCEHGQEKALEVCKSQENIPSRRKYHLLLQARALSPDPEEEGVPLSPCQATGCRWWLW